MCIGSESSFVIRQDINETILEAVDVDEKGNNYEDAM
jgi:hypothetical protein